MRMKVPRPRPLPVLLSPPSPQVPVPLPSRLDDVVPILLTPTPLLRFLPSCYVGVGDDHRQVTNVVWNGGGHHRLKKNGISSTKCRRFFFFSSSSSSSSSSVSYCSSGRYIVNIDIHSSNKTESSNNSVRYFATQKEEGKEETTTKGQQNEQQQWDTMFRRLLKYKQEHDGSTLVPQNYEDGQYKLGQWVKRQRSLYKNKKLKAEQIVQLEAIQFWWNARDGLWEQCFDALVKYKHHHDGSTLVPKRYSPNPTMANWVSTQRKFYKQNLLSKERIDRLDEIGFVWDPLEQSWEEMFQQWIDVSRTKTKKKKKNENKSKNVAGDDNNDNDDDDKDNDDNTAASLPSTSTTTTTATRETPTTKHRISSTRLQEWIEVQRMYYAEGKLNETRYRRLCDEGFEFEPRNSSWWESYRKLERYHRLNGGRTDIPYIYDEDPPLGRWVHTQRASYKKGRLPQDRVDALDKLQFEWEIRRTSTKHQ